VDYEVSFTIVHFRGPEPAEVDRTVSRQWADKRKAATSATVQPKPPSPPPREEPKEPAKPVEVEPSLETTKGSLSTAKSKVKPRPTVKKHKEPEEEEIKPVVAEETKDVKRSLAESAELSRVKDEAYSPLIFSSTLSRTPLFVPPRHPSPSIQFVDPKAILKSSDNHVASSLDTSSLLVHVDDLQSLLAKEEEKETELEPAPILSARIEEKEQMIELPALALGIGTWSRRADVDPSQLRAVYSSKTDALIFSTEHLEASFFLSSHFHSNRTLNNLTLHALSYIVRLSPSSTSRFNHRSHSIPLSSSITQLPTHPSRSFDIDDDDDDDDGYSFLFSSFRSHFK